MGVLDIFKRKEPEKPRGFQVEVTGADIVKFENIPPKVQKFMWGAVITPWATDSPNADLFANCTLFTRNDGILTYAASVLPNGDSIAIKNPVSICIDYDESKDEVVGEAWAESSFRGPGGFAELRVFDTYAVKRGQSLSYPRLLILNKFSVESLKRFLASGHHTERKKESGMRPALQFAAGEHVWTALKGHLDGKPGPFVIKKINGVNFFAPAFEAVAAEETRRLSERLQQFLRDFPPEKRSGDVLPQMALYVQSALELLRNTPHIMKATIRNQGSVRTLYAIPQYNAGALFFDDVDGQLSGGGSVLFAPDGEKTAPYVSWIGTLPNFQNKGMNIERLKRIAVYGQSQKWQPMQADIKDLVNKFARQSWDRLVEDRLAVREGDRFRFLT